MMWKYRVLGCLAAVPLVAGGCGGGTDCVPQSRLMCESGLLLWADSCGKLGEVVRNCECGCSEDGLECRTPCDNLCTPKASTDCDAEHGTLFWVDSCGSREEVAEVCRCGCAAGGKVCTGCDCTPSCAGRCGGDDGCQGTCPDTCDHIEETCDPQTFTCVPCTPKSCVGQGYDCGDWDNGCGRVRSCGTCPHELVCDLGHCGIGCTGGTTDCYGTCVDMETDRLHCGSCDRVCLVGTECVGGDCANPCSGELKSCPAGCVDLKTDNANCGTCGRGCTSGTECAEGDCVASCSGGLKPCHDGCVDLDNDNTNCGTCGRECPTGQSCRDGDCGARCSEGLERCSDGCVDVTRDSTNCGTCGRACPSGQSCKDSDCTPVSLTCPCSAGYYCDLASNTCKPGCQGDGDCSAGSICEDRTCRTGCRDDAICGDGRICQSTQCIAGCRDDAACGTGHICQNLQCAEGCRQDSQCGSGKICSSGTCRTGCRGDEDCTVAGQLCDPDLLTCLAGCRVEADCSIGQVCSADSRTCVSGCSSDARCPAGQICESSQCRAGCRAAADCKSGQVCSKEFRCGLIKGSGYCLTDSDCVGDDEHCNPLTLSCTDKRTSDLACSEPEGCGMFACTTGEVCGKGLCTVRADGDYCTGSIRCGKGYTCSTVSLKCGRLDCFADGTCEEGFACQTLSTCQLTYPRTGKYCGPMEGTPCPHYWDCGAAKCIGGTCAVRYDCPSQGNCPSNAFGCYNGKCTPYDEIPCATAADCGNNNLGCNKMIGRCTRNK